MKGVEGGAGGQQSWWLNHSNQTCESEDKMRVGVNGNVDIFSEVDFMVQKKYKIGLRPGPQVPMKNEVTR